MAFVRSDTKRKVDINYVSGSTGAGKSHWIKQQIANDPRLVVFDPDDEYGDVPGIVTVSTPAKAIELMKQNRTTPLKVRVIGFGKAVFEALNAAVFVWTNCTYVAEEIADVTSVAKAPPQWGKLLRRGRKRAIRIFAVTQRPSEADKTALTQASLIRTGLLGREPDRKSLASDLDIHPSYIAKLGPLDFIECHKNAARSVFIGNAEQGTRVDATEKVRGSALTE